MDGLGTTSRCNYAHYEMYERQTDEGPAADGEPSCYRPSAATAPGRP